MHCNAGPRLFAACLGFASACGDGPTERLAECTEPVTVSVTAGTTPMISWTPACGIGFLTVRRPVSVTTGFEMEPQWTISSDGRLIGPPVRYGVRPRGTTQPVAPRQLVAGVSYDVVVDMSGQGVLGSHFFTP